MPKVRLNSILLSFLLLVSSQCIYAQQTGVGGTFWQRALEALANGLGSVNLESATLGTDKGVISGAIIGIGRDIEKNPRATGDHDRYIVKDRMRLGFELGAGYVAAGTVVYAQEWTLLYTAPSEMDGLLSRGFIVDLFLPKTIHDIEYDKLPEEYVILKESYLEGRGRLRFSDLGVLPLGNQFSLGKVELSSEIFKHYKDGHYDLMTEKSSFIRGASELWIDMMIFNIPLFDAVASRGRASREYRTLSADQWERSMSELERQEFMRAAFVGRGETNAILESPLLKKIETKFNERTTALNIFWLITKDSHIREDYVTQTQYLPGSDESLTTSWWQWESRVDHEWTVGIRSERYSSRVFMSTKPSNGTESFETDSPQIHVVMKLYDDETKKGELEEEYFNFVTDFINVDKSVFLHGANVIADNFNGIRTDINIGLSYGEENVERLLSASEKELSRSLKKITGKSLAVWEKAAKESFHSENRRRLRQTRYSLNDIARGKQVSKMVDFLKHAKKSYERGEILLSYRQLAQAMRVSIYTGGIKGHQTELLQVLNDVINNDYAVAVDQDLWKDESFSRHYNYSKDDSFLTQSTNQQERFILNDPSEIFYFFE